MGGTAWSDEHYRSRAKRLRKSGRSAFGYDEDVRAQRVVEGVHKMMDPARIRGGIRESRDSEAHPRSRAVTVLFDVTGSMLEAPRILQKNLCSLFGLLLKKDYLEDPAVLVGAVGDATCDVAPLQVGQFESGNEIEDDLSRLYLEGGGGGGMRESYELALYFLARKTEMDCLEKRGQKGYAFLLGDEKPYGKVKRREVKEVFGDDIPKDVPIARIIEEVREKHELFFIIPNLTSYYNDKQILNCWRKLLGQNVLRLDDPAGVSELIASTIGLSEDAVGHEDLSAELCKAGTGSKVAEAVASALAHVTRTAGPRGAGLSKL
ncbi:MAG: hypothetical protein N2C14_03835 [Planctomycetales bacterium]